MTTYANELTGVSKPLPAQQIWRLTSAALGGPTGMGRRGLVDRNGCDNSSDYQNGFTLFSMFFSLPRISLQ